MVFSIIPQMEKKWLQKFFSAKLLERHTQVRTSLLSSQRLVFLLCRSAALLAHGGICVPKKKGQKAQCMYQILVNGERGLCWNKFSAVAQSCPDSLWPHGLQQARLPCPLPTPRVYSSSCALSWRCRPTISFPVVPFSSRLQSFPASGSFPMSQFFASGGQSVGVSASATVLPMNIQDWFPLGWTCWISLQSKGLSRVFSNTTVQKHQFFSTQLSL